jgi:hypothetical protein
MNMRSVARIEKYASSYYSFIKNALSGANEVWARKIITEAWKQVFGTEPTVQQAQLVQAVCRLESSYGRGWKSTEGNAAHNWGAVQLASSKQHLPGFKNQDSLPGTGNVKTQTYVTKFKVYSNDVDGAADVIRICFKQNPQQRFLTKERQLPDWNKPGIPGPGRAELCMQAAEQGDIFAFSRAMYFTGYYGGFGDNFKIRITNHAKGLENHIKTIAAGNNEPQAVFIKSTSALPVTTDQRVIDYFLATYPFLNESGQAIQTGNAEMPNLDMEEIDNEIYRLWHENVSLSEE